MALPELTLGTEPGFADMTLAVTTATSGSGLRYVATAQHGGQEVAISVELHGPWIAGRLDNDVNLVVCRGRVDLIRTDPRSDALVKVMDGLYGTALAAEQMASRVAFSAVSLAGDPAHPELGMVKLKLFHGDADSADHVELYLNLDTPQQRLQLREKDPDYRAAVVRTLMALRP
jgi:hypothetical protein